ncbi:MAG TPA: hypothetical protein V6D22_13170 [Candidatus Obscuribacterales bacterium]
MNTKTITTTLVAALSVQASMLPQCVWADTISYTPVAGHTSGLLDGQAPVGRIADLRLDGAKASFAGNSFAIRTAGSSDPALYGVMLNPDLNTSGKRAKFYATAFLQGGDKLSQIRGADGRDTVHMKDNSQVAGTIKTIDSSKLVMDTTDGTKQIDIKSIAEIDSPRMVPMSVVAQAPSTIEPGQCFTADASSVQMDMNGGRCAPKRHRAQQIRPRTETTTKEWRSESTSTSQTPVPMPEAQAPAPPTTVVEGNCQPAVIETVPVARPAVVECPTHPNYLLMGIGGLLLAGGIATAITLPIVLHHHHHHDVGFEPVYFDGFAFR